MGHVHALAHQLGGFYQVPHGLANAIILPLVLHELRPSVDRRLGRLADMLGLTEKKEKTARKAQAFIAMIEELNDKMNLSNEFGTLIKKDDIPLMAQRAYREAFPLYPVPVLWDEGRYVKLYKSLRKEN